MIKLTLLTCLKKAIKSEDMMNDSYPINKYFKIIIQDLKK